MLDEDGERMKFRGIDKYIVHRMNKTLFADKATGATSNSVDIRKASPKSKGQN